VALAFKETSVVASIPNSTYWDCTNVHSGVAHLPMAAAEEGVSVMVQRIEVVR